MAAGLHCFIDLYGCLANQVNDENYILSTLTEAAENNGATVLHRYSYCFDPQGVTAMLVLAESHISFHSWPEAGFISMDVFTCGENIDMAKCVSDIKKGFKHIKARFITHTRGESIIRLENKYVNSPISQKKKFDITDLRYKVYGTLFVTGNLIVREYGKEKKQSTLIECICRCGNIVYTTRPSLLRGRIKGCGCTRRKYDTEDESVWQFLFHKFKSGSRQRSIENIIDFATFKSISSLNCYYCGREPSQESKYTTRLNIKYNGIDRINSGMGYTLDNIRPCCKWCNIAKMDLPEDEFYTLVKNIYRHMGLDKI